MKHLAAHLAFAAATAFALAVAAPAWAHDCGDCCAKKSKQSAQASDPAAKDTPATAADAPKKCECEKGGKGCICKKGECKCQNCGAHKLSAADEKPKCQCEKGGKGCICKKGECKCQNCGAHKHAA